MQADFAMSLYRTELPKSFTSIKHGWLVGVLSLDRVACKKHGLMEIATVYYILGDLNLLSELLDQISQPAGVFLPDRLDCPSRQSVLTPG